MYTECPEGVPFTLIHTYIIILLLLNWDMTELGLHSQDALYGSVVYMW